MGTPARTVHERRADVAAGATVVGVGVRVYAGPTTERLTGAWRSTAPAATVCAIGAAVAAGATVVGVAAGVYAASTAARLTRRAAGPVAERLTAKGLTAPIHTVFATLAGVAAGATVVVITARVCAARTAAGLTRLAAVRTAGLTANGLTVPVHTACATLAGVAALATVLVSAQVHASSAAAGFTRLAAVRTAERLTANGLTVPVHTACATLAGVAALATVLVSAQVCLTAIG